MEWPSPQVTLVPARHTFPGDAPIRSSQAYYPVLPESGPWPLLGTMNEVGEVINLPPTPMFHSEEKILLEERKETQWT